MWDCLQFVEGTWIEFNHTNAVAWYILKDCLSNFVFLLKVIPISLVMGARCNDNGFGPFRLQVALFIIYD